MSLTPRLPARTVVGTLLAALALSGCSGSTPTAAPAPSQTPTSPVTPTPAFTCPPAPHPTFTWPEGVPADLPVPPAGRIVSHRKTTEGLTIVEFTTAASLRDGVLFLVSVLPKKGYTLGRGDAEPSEADAPFFKGTDVRGVYRMVASQACETKWLMAVTLNASGSTGTPLLPYHKGPSPSPLPFGQ